MKIRAWLTGVLLAPAATVAQIAEFIPLGHLPGPFPYSEASDVSASGLLVVGSSRSDVGYWGEAFRWDEEVGMVGLGVLPEHNQSQAVGISPEGGWVVGRSVLSPEHVEAMAWSTGTGMFGLGDLPGGDFDSIARAVSRYGRVIVGTGSTETDGQEHGEAFMWTRAGGMQGLGDLPGGNVSSSARDISADGRVIVGSSRSEFGGEAFRWTPEGGMVGLGAIDPDRFASGARAVSNNGLWIAGSSRTGIDDGGGTTSANQAVLWTPAGDIIGLGWLQDSGARASRAFDVTNDGGIVVGDASGLGDFPIGAFLWTPEDGMRELREVLLTDYNLDVEAMGWSLDLASAISPDGSVIVGIGANPDGRGEAWMVRLPVPAPSTLGLLAPCCLLARRRGRA